jgi:hypothetical protein
MVRLFVVLALVCCVSVAAAETIQFDMPGLTGGSADTVAVDSLVYHGPPAVVNSVSFRVTGYVSDLGEICCGGPAYCPGDTYPWFLAWWGTIDKFSDAYGKWAAATTDYLDQAIAFDQTDVAESQDGFPSLSEGDVFDVQLYFGQGGWVGECDLIRPPAGTLVTVTIFVDVSYALPAESATWGRIKALFD